jgi:hypothetical protein
MLGCKICLLCPFNPHHGSELILVRKTLHSCLIYLLPDPLVLAIHNRADPVTGGQIGAEQVVHPVGSSNFS